MAQRATSLGPKPSLLFFLFGVFFVCFFPFLSLLVIQKNLVFPLEKGHFLFIFECLPSFLLSLFWPPPFSIYLSLSLSLLLVLFFLPSCLLFLLYFASLFLSLSFLVLLLCFCFMKRTTSKY